MYYITSFHCKIVGKNKAGLGKNSDFLLSLLTFLYKSRMVCEKIRRRTMESCDETHTLMADEFEEKGQKMSTFQRLLPTPHATKG